jgi:hypothetical protein
MLVTAITTWDGTPAGIEAVIEGSRLAGPIHESLGARNPRLMRSFAGSDLYRVEYMIDFDSFEACGAFTDAMLGHEWFVQMTANVAAAYPELKTAEPASPTTRCNERSCLRLSTRHKLGSGSQAGRLRNRRVRRRRSLHRQLRCSR